MSNPKKNKKIFNVVLAVILAMGVWLYVINVENPTGTVSVRDIPVTISGEDALADQGLMIVDQSKESVTLKLTGRRKTLMRLSRSNISLELDVSSITTEGEHTLSCQHTFPATVSSDSVTISDWEDLRITVTVERQVTKKIPVRGEFIGTEADNCLAGAVTTDPDTITLTGPGETLEGISYALASVGGREISETLTEEVSVVFMGPDGTPANWQNVTASAETVEVTVPVRQVTEVPLTVNLVAGGGAETSDVRVAITPSTITVAGEEGVELPASISLGEIDLSDVLGDTSYAIPISAHMPDGVAAWGNGDRFATVSITFSNLETKQLAVEDIELINIPQGCQAKLASQAIYIWVRGTPEAVEALKTSQLQVVVDLSGASLDGSLQRFDAAVALTEDAPEGIGIMGTHYSVALTLSS